MSTGPDGKRFGSPLPEVMPFIMAGTDYLFNRELKQAAHEVRRKIYMRRRDTAGNYESTWQEIEERRIMSYGSVKMQIDAVKPFYFDQSGITLKFDNTDGYFSDETHAGSFWNGYMNQFRTLVKVTAAYYDVTTETEFPSSTTLFYGILSEEPKLSRDNTASISFKSLLSVFDEVSAKDLSINSVATTTSDRFINLIKNHTDSNGIAIFQKYFSTGAWNMDTGTASFPNLNTTTAVGGDTCLGLLKKIAQADNRVVYIAPGGSFNFKSRTAGATSVYAFHGGARYLGNQSHTIKTINDYSRKVNKIYNQVRIKYASAATETSYYEKKETWTWGDSSSSFLYGVRVMPEISNEWLNLSQATAMGDSIFTEFQYPKMEIDFTSKYFPALNPLDRYTVSYQVTTDDSSIWNAFKWDSGLWGGGLQHLEFTDKAFYTLSITHDLDKFTTQIVGREI